MAESPLLGTMTKTHCKSAFSGEGQDSQIAEIFPPSAHFENDVLGIGPDPTKFREIFPWVENQP
jgi:hypothetical protein